MKRILIMTALSVFALSAVAQDKNPFIPEIHGTIRAKYEYEPQIDKGRFEIRNALLTGNFFFRGSIADDHPAQHRLLKE